jgi:outer membrane protein
MLRRSTHTQNLLAKQLCLVALLLCAPLVTHADDLLSLYRAGVENDPRYRAAQASYNAVQEKVPQAWGNLLPRAQASAVRNRNDERAITDSVLTSRPAGNAEYRSSEYSLSVTQPIVNIAAYVGVRQANAEVRRAEAEFAAAKHDLALRLAEAYFQFLLAQDTQVLVAAEKQALSQHFDAAQARHRAGVVGISEVEDARARWQIAIAQEIDTTNRVEDRRQALREIVGRLPPQLAGLGDQMPPLTIEPLDVERWVETSLSRNPTVIAATEAADSARDEVARIRSDHAPTLDLVGSRNRTDADGSITGPGVRTDTAIVGLQLKVPLLQGGQVLSRTREAAYRHDAALQELESRRRNAERSTRASFRDVSGTAARVDSLRQAVVSGEIALEAKTQGFRAGVYHTLDVLDATRELFRTKRDFSEARYTYLAAYLRLKHAAGTLSDDDLDQLNRALKN